VCAYTGTNGEKVLNSIGKPTVAVVSIILVLEGKELVKVTDRKSLKKCLTMLAHCWGGRISSGQVHSSPLRSCGPPEEPWDVLEKKDLYLEYPKLMPL
jgi:hypothetical protein